MKNLILKSGAGVEKDHLNCIILEDPEKKVNLQKEDETDLLIGEGEKGWIGRIVGMRGVKG